MNFVIISHVDHTIKENLIYGYGPYIREMNLWLKGVESVEVVANVSNREVDKIDLAYNHNNIKFTKLKAFDLTSSTKILKAIAAMPMLLITIFKAMKTADHIHLRCPGNVGLLGCMVQILFPNKPKTAKYAGNWDPKSKQPWSYKLQQWILNNTFLTKNMQVLVYGEWPNMSKNIKPFFTATYTNKDVQKAVNLPVKHIPSSSEDNIVFMFVGTLTANKRPMYALQVFYEIIKTKTNCILNFYGEGPMRKELEAYIYQNKLTHKVFLHGNKNTTEVANAYQHAHFLFLASQSEGWPKVVAEAMFWGCVPLATNVSCVQQMMGYGERGLLLQLDIKNDTQKILSSINDSQKYTQMSEFGKKWSTNYTIDKFEQEIKKLL